MESATFLLPRSFVQFCLNMSDIVTFLWEEDCVKETRLENDVKMARNVHTPGNPLVYLAHKIDRLV